MGLFDLFFKPKNEQKNTKPQPQNWREAMAAESNSKAMAAYQEPKLTKKECPKLCPDLNVPEKTRKKLEKLLIDESSSRSGALVDDFFLIAEEDGVSLQFPQEIYDILNSRRKRGTCTEKQVASVYIRHEEEKLRTVSDMKKFKKMRITHVVIRTAEDQRVCPICQKHSKKKYRIDEAPVIPMCWECRCYYEPVIK